MNLTVKELRDALAGLEDNTPVVFDGVDGDCLSASCVIQQGSLRRVLEIKGHPYMDDDE